jgi:hypothetical protein
VIAKNIEVKTKREAERQVNAWNAAHKVGTPVILSKDDGSQVTTVTRHPASLIAGYIPVVWLDGVSGCYRLDRVKAVEG